jgi:hypothetical protein
MELLMLVYLCGPINGCTDEECRDWREYVKERLPNTLDPMRRDYRGKEAESVRDIVELDKIDVARCDALIVNYEKPSVGTSMEMIWAWERGKFIVLVCREDVSLSPWLRYHAHRIVHSFDDAVSVLSEAAE